jgi:glycosyltransferase involved in cell wall biosynthesis
VSRGLAILIVTQFAPPAGFSAARRVGALAKYLDRLGHSVTVLTSLASGRGPVEGAQRTLRTRDLIVSRVSWRRSRFEALREGSEASYSAEPSRLARLVVPDLSLIGWVPFALPKALRLAREQPLDCVLTTSPPESAHLVGMALRRRGVAWVADLRDGWRFETTHPDWPLALQHRLDDALERTVGREADLVTAVTDPIAEDLRRRLGANAVTVPNGFDPEERPSKPPREVQLSPDRHSLVHTGRMAFSGRTPASLLEGVRRLRVAEPELASRLDLVFAGPVSSEERRLIEDASLRGAARAVGTLSHEESLRLQAAADGLLLLTGRSRRSEATAKLYEYLAAGRPVLVLGEDTTAATIVQDTEAGLVTSATDPDRIATALKALLETRSPHRIAPAVERFSYPAIAAQLATRLEEVVTARAES